MSEACHDDRIQEGRTVRPIGRNSSGRSCVLKPEDMSGDLGKALRTVMRAEYKSRNVYVNGRRTSMRLDMVLWNALCDIAIHEEVTVSALLDTINASLDAQNSASLSARTRSFIVSYYKSKVRL